MRIFIQDHSVAPKQSVRRALDILLKAGVYADGGILIGDRAAVIVNSKYVRNAVVALTKAGVRTVFE